MTNTHSSDNIFADLGRPDPEVRLLRAYLASALDTAIAGRDWTQTQAAEATGLTQPEVSNLLRGRITGFTIDRLVRSLLRIGYDLRVDVCERSDQGQGRVQFPERATEQTEPEREAAV